MKPIIKWPGALIAMVIIEKGKEVIITNYMPAGSDFRV